MMNIPGHVIGVDIDIRSHNRDLIESHPMSDIITMIEGSSTSPEVFEKIKSIAKDYNKILVILDSLHTHNHVLEELNLYSQLVSLDSYLIVTDTFVEFFPEGYFASNRPWDKGNNPYTALTEFMKNNTKFKLDEEISSKACITETIDGYLKRVN